MKSINVVAIDYAQGFPLIGCEEAGFIVPEIEPGRMTANLEKIGVAHQVYSPVDPLAIGRELSAYCNEKSVILSRDHMMTYYGLQARGVKKDAFGLIVLDQHIDLYSYQTHGNWLNKCNALRFAFDRNLFDRLVVIGARDSEESEFDDFHRLFVPDYDRIFEGKRYAGFEEILQVVPVSAVRSVFDAVKGAVDDFYEKGIRKIGIDIDLDCFDSNLITGVQFNSSFPDSVREKMGDYSADFISGQLLEKGLPIEGLRNQIVSICHYLQQKGMELVYRAITEYEPESDANGLTLKVIEEILAGFEEGLEP